MYYPYKFYLFINNIYIFYNHLLWCFLWCLLFTFFPFLCFLDLPLLEFDDESEDESLSELDEELLLKRDVNGNFTYLINGTGYTGFIGYCIY